MKYYKDFKREVIARNDGAHLKKRAEEIPANEETLHYQLSKTLMS